MYNADGMFDAAFKDMAEAVSTALKDYQKATGPAEAPPLANTNVKVFNTASPSIDASSASFGSGLTIPTAPP